MSEKGVFSTRVGVWGGRFLYLFNQITGRAGNTNNKEEEKGIMRKYNDDLLISAVARICQCHIRTVQRWIDKGVITVAYRDVNGYRRFTMEDALVLKSFLSLKRRGPVAGWVDEDTE